jgi:hypothetical protein
VALPRCFPTPVAVWETEEVREGLLNLDVDLFLYRENILLTGEKNQNKSAKKVNIILTVNHLTFGAATYTFLK